MATIQVIGRIGVAVAALVTNTLEDFTDLVRDFRLQRFSEKV